MFRQVGRYSKYAWSRCRPLPRKGKPHGLPAPLIVSLTSYLPRFRTLAATLRCLLTQTIAADRLILWVAREDCRHLPGNVRALQRHGLSIRTTDDIGSYKKIVPTLGLFANAFIATADDDLAYAPDWIESLVSGYRGDLTEIVCRRAHRIILDGNGIPLPYFQWELDTGCTRRSKLLFPTGVGGILYPPGSLHDDVSRKEIFSELAPTADDVWLYWMARLKGSSFRRTGPRPRLIYWPNSQTNSLWERKKAGGISNDDQINAMAAKYGFPFD